jgi:hypothetical protein
MRLADRAMTTIIVTNYASTMTLYNYINRNKTS